jgi:hypothetical protein
VQLYVGWGKARARLLAVVVEGGKRLDPRAGGVILAQDRLQKLI